MSCSSLSSRKLSCGHFGKCQSILQEISWMIDNWENSLQPLNITNKEDEITNCENALLKVKDMIWTTCLSLFSKYEPQTKVCKGLQRASICARPETKATKIVKCNTEVAAICARPEMKTTKTVNCNTEAMTHERNNISVAVHQQEASHMVVVSGSPSQRIVKNLLFDWSVYVNPQFQLCLVGSLPNGGKWETSPIAVKLGPTSVKTISGTMYSMHGKMVVREGIDVPDFVREKFQEGFPYHWKTIANKWISKLKGQKYGISSSRISRKNATSAPFVVLNDIARQQAAIPRQFSQQNGKLDAPLPKEDARTEPLPIEDSRREPFPKEDSRREPLPMENIKHQPSSSTSRNSFLLQLSQSQQKKVIKGSAVMPRYSRRLLTRSFVGTLCSSEGNQEIPPKKNANEEKFHYLKNWTIFLSRKKDTLVLFGTLIDEKGNILQENHYSPPIAHRIQADIVETRSGNHYRLVGLSASRGRYYDFGFPTHWKKFLKELRSGQLPSQPLLETSQGAQNGTNNKSKVGKRNMYSVSLHPRRGAPIKRRRVTDENPDQEKVRHQNDSVLSEPSQSKEFEKIPLKPTKTVEPE